MGWIQSRHAPIISLRQWRQCLFVSRILYWKHWCEWMWWMYQERMKTLSWILGPTTTPCEKGRHTSFAGNPDPRAKSARHLLEAHPPVDPDFDCPVRTILMGHCSIHHLFQIVLSNFLVQQHDSGHDQVQLAFQQTDHAPQNFWEIWMVSWSMICPSHEMHRGAAPMWTEIKSWDEHFWNGDGHSEEVFGCNYGATDTDARTY